MSKKFPLISALFIIGFSSHYTVANARPVMFLVPENTMSKDEIYKQTIELIKDVKSQGNIIDISHPPIGLGFVSSPFGMRKDPIDGLRRMHKGIDIAAQSGSMVKPLGSGEVIYSGYKSGYGNLVEIKHGNTVVTRYAHLKRFSVNVGQKVDTSDTIGLVGNTGRSTGPHLHLEVLFNDRQVDPKVFLANKFQTRAVYYAKVNEANQKAKVVNVFVDPAIDKDSNINKVSLYDSADGYDVLNNVTQLDYKDYVDTLNGLYGLSAPLSSR